MSGDFYWFHHIKEEGVESKNEKKVIAGIDCTGHGVPGAFMSVIADALLNNAVMNQGLSNTAEILNYLHLTVRKRLKSDQTQTHDGMDMSICILDEVNKKMYFSGAKQSLIYFQDDKIHVIKGNVLSIGGFFKNKERVYTQHCIDISETTTVYMMSDGYLDQFGGENIRKFGTKRVKELLLQIHKLDMKKQKEIIKDTLQKWQGNQKQIDDILMIGFRI